MNLNLNKTLFVYIVILSLSLSSTLINALRIEEKGKKMFFAYLHIELHKAYNPVIVRNIWVSMYLGPKTSCEIYLDL